MSTQQPAPLPPEYDGLVIEDAHGVRLLALPAAIVPVLRSAAVLRFRLGDSVFNMRVAPQLPVQRTQDGPRVEPPQQSSGSAPTPEYGAPALPVHGARNPSPTPPPAHEQDQEDPADIPIRVRRNGEWTTVHVTREQYERYEREGKLTHEPPADYEGNQQ
jgi:hypothetical protein